MILQKKWIRAMAFKCTVACLFYPYLNAQDKVDYLQKYEGSSLDHVAMPIGGIGTGTVSVDSRGKLVDREIMNQGFIGFVPFFNEHWAATRVAPFFAIRTKTMDVNYIGPNPEMATWYLCALRAGEEMAKVMKDPDG
jgi:hypothetical protein